MMTPHPFELFVPYTTTEQIMRDRDVRRCTLPPPPVFDTTSSPPPASASASAAAFPGPSPPQRTHARKKRIPLYQLRASGSSKMTRVTKPFIHYKQYSDTFYTLWHSSRESPADRDERAEPAHRGGKENGAASPHSPALPRSPAPLCRAHKEQNHDRTKSLSSTPCTSYSSSLTSCTSSSTSAADSTASRSRCASSESNFFFGSEWQDTEAPAFDTSLGPYQCSESPMTPLSSTSSSSLSSLPTSIEGGSEEEDEEEDERLDQFTNFVLGGLRAIRYEEISKRARTVASLKRKRGGFLVGVEVALS